MTLANLLADVYRREKYGTVPASTVTTRITAFINETQQELASDPRLASILRGETTLATVASQAEYGLPPQVNRVTKVRDSAHYYALKRSSLDWYRRAVPNQAVDVGNPERYIPLGPKPVAQQPAAATGVWAASSSASDTTLTVSLEAIRTGGYVHQPAATTLTGTARVQIGAQTDYVEIVDVYLSAAPVGDVTLFDAVTAGNTLGVIPKGQTRSTYQWVALAPTPSGVVTLAIDYERTLTDLVNSTDEPYWLPPSFHRLLAIGARRKEYEYHGDTRLTAAIQDWTVGLQMLIASVNNPPDGGVIPGGPRMGRSDLGPNYPAGTVWD